MRYVGLVSVVECGCQRSGIVGNWLLLVWRCRWCGVSSSIWLAIMALMVGGPRKALHAARDPPCPLRRADAGAAVVVVQDNAAVAAAHMVVVCAR
jgi:hypothetical protein